MSATDTLQPTTEPQPWTVWLLDGPDSRTISLEYLGATIETYDGSRIYDWVSFDEPRRFGVARRRP